MVTPDHTSKDWLLYCLNEGFSQRQMALLSDVSTPTIRLWLKKHNIKWRNISESLLAQSDEVSRRAKEVWADTKKRQKQSETMKIVQAGRKKELSESAKRNWANNRDKIIIGIRSVSRNSSRLSKLSELSKSLWQDDGYRSSILSQRKNFDNQEYRDKISQSLSGPRLTTAEFVEHAKRIWADAFDYSSVNFVGSCYKIQIICNQCKKQFWQLPGDHIKYGNCKYCNMSSGQRFLTNIVADHNPILNDRQKITPYELDIFLPNRNLAIEHHGLYWHSYDHLETVAEKLSHQNKWELCAKNNIRLLQFFEHEIIQKPILIKSMINNILGNSIALGARELIVSKINNREAAKFLEENHLQGYRPAKYIYCLATNNEIIMIISFSNYRDGYEIIRMATKSGYHVCGGTSRLIHNFRKHTSAPIYTYSDLRISNGAVYSKLGFQEILTTKPGYFYCKGLSTLSRQQCQKHKLHKLLDKNFDNRLTEAENMFNNGYRRMWDAGHKKFVLL